MDIKKEALELHRVNRGKIGIKSKVNVNNDRDLTLAYSPGVAEPCREIDKNREELYKYTNKGNFVAVVTDGSAVLGLGNIKAEASLPVMEGKAVLFKEFAAIDAFPIALKNQKPDKIVEYVKNIAPIFGGINLEDIAGPKCFYIEEKLKEELDIPVFHDDQHGTAIITMSGLINAAKLVNKKLEELKVVINGAGAAGFSIAKLLLEFGVEEIIVLDSKGAIYEGRQENMNPYKDKLAVITNRSQRKGDLEEIIANQDVFIGVSVANILTKKMVASMKKDPIVFAMANPDPEINPEDALTAGAKIVGTGRSDYPNQVNNVLAFPGIFRGALDVRATEINMEMKKAAANALANLIDEKELNSELVIPKPFDPRVGPHLAASVARAAIKTGVAAKDIKYSDEYKNVEKLLNIKV